MTAVKHIEVWNKPYHYDPKTPLLSIHLGSNRVDKLTEFVKELEAVTSNKNAYEVNVKIDSEDEAMIACVRDLQSQFGEEKIKPLIAPKKKGLWSLWEYYNVLLKNAHPECYFFWNPSDEVRIVTPGWDQILKRYIGAFDDHIFRLKLSDNRLRNYYGLEEILGTPDNFPFITKKWMDICQTWGDCHSPDLFHQGVSYFLGKMNVFRDIPIFDIDLTGIEAGCLLTPAQQKERHKGCQRVWKIALSKSIQKRYYAHARKLYFYIESCQIQAEKIEFDDFIGDKLLCKNDKGVSKQYRYTTYNYISKDGRSLLEKTVSFIAKRIKKLESILIRCYESTLFYGKKIVNKPLLFMVFLITSFSILWSDNILVRSVSLLFCFLSLFIIKTLQRR